jgi:phage FluMu protein Com
MSLADVVARWDAFLSKIDRAFEDLLNEARLGCLELAQANETVAMSNAWQGVRSEVFALTERIGTTWRDKVEATFEQSGLEGAALHEQEMRGRALERSMLHRFERKEIELYGEAGEFVLARARDEEGREFRCTQCGAALPVPARALRSVHVTCDYCRAVNTFEPGTHVRAVEHFCGHHLSQRAALEQWEAMKAAEHLRRDTRGETPEVRAQLERTTRAYWQAYFSARAQLLPELEQDIAREVEARMRGFKQLASPS